MRLAAHPLRRHILLRLTDRSLSANQLAEQLETTVPAVLYHLTVLANHQVTEPVHRNDPSAKTTAHSLLAGRQRDELLDLARELDCP